MEILMVIAKMGFRDEEFFVPYGIFKSKGITVDVASTEAGQCMGKLGGIAEANKSFKDIDIYDYSGVLIVGGPGSKELIGDPDLENILKHAAQKDIIISAICFAPVILAHAGLLAGKEVTAWNEDGLQKAVILDSGGSFVDQDVVVSGKLITANGPGAAEKFAHTIIDKLMG